MTYWLSCTPGSVDVPTSLEVWVFNCPLALHLRKTASVLCTIWQRYLGHFNSTPFLPCPPSLYLISVSFEAKRLSVLVKVQSPFSCRVSPMDSWIFPASLRYPMEELFLYPLGEHVAFSMCCGLTFSSMDSWIIQCQGVQRTIPVRHTYMHGRTCTHIWYTRQPDNNLVLCNWQSGLGLSN